MPLRNFSYLLPDEVAGVARPDSVSALEELVRLGFHTLVALGNLPPEPWPAGLTILHREVADFSRIPVRALHEAVLAIQGATRKVAVCCGEGIGRTGVVLACYLVSLGRSAYQAIAEVRSARPAAIDHVALEISVHDYSEFLVHSGRAGGSHPGEPLLAATPAGMWAKAELWAPSADRDGRRLRPATTLDRDRPEALAETASGGGRLSYPRSSVFLMTRFREHDLYSRLDVTLSTALSEYALILHRADRTETHDLLWTNVEHHMDHCAYGVAVFDTVAASEVSPNVCLELGYMLGQKRKCLLLKERRVASLQADLSGHLFEEFDADRLEETVRPAVFSWLERLGIRKKTHERLVVFVSSGGTCRDPIAKVIAARLLRERAPGAPIRFEAMATGEPSLDGASVAARAAVRELFGEDLLAEHRAARLTPTLKGEADLLVAMDRGLLKGLPAERSTTFLELFTGRAGDVKDPWPDGEDKRTRAKYRRCAVQIRDTLEQGFRRLLNRLHETPS